MDQPPQRAQADPRLAPPALDRPEQHLGPFILSPPECTVEWHGRQDFYLPDEDRNAGVPTPLRPAVVLVHGGPVPAQWLPTPRDWPVYVGYARALAAMGALAVPVDHRFHAPEYLDVAAQDIRAAVNDVRADPRVDPGRVALWFFSGGGLLAAEWLAAPPAWLRCVALTYPWLAPPPGVDARYCPTQTLPGAGDLPIVLTRVGRERPQVADTVAQFLGTAQAVRARVHLIDVPHGEHGFDYLEPTEQSRSAVKAALRAVIGLLG